MMSLSDEEGEKYCGNLYSERFYLLHNEVLIERQYPFIFAV